MTDLKALVRAQLEAIGADGLVYPEIECGCGVADPMPCMEGMHPTRCVAARLKPNAEWTEEERAYAADEGADGLYWPMEVTTGRGRCCECGEIVGVQDGETVAHQHGGVQCCGSHCRPESLAESDVSR